MMFKYALVASVGIASAFAAAVPAVDLKSVLQQTKNKWSPNTQIFFPTDPNYTNETTQRWNFYSAPSYLASIKPGSEADVQKVVKLATAYKFPFLATGGGHGYGTTFGLLQNGLELDLGHFKTVDVNAEGNTMTIGGAVTFAEIVDPLYNAGKQIPTGSCSCVGMVGATLGAGVGRYQGLHGLIIDNLLSVRMITAKGDIITVSAQEHSDLFWGLRGAGMNFGVILSATYHVFDLVNDGDNLNVDLVFPASANLSYFNLLKTFQDRLPAPLSLFTLIDYNTTNNGAILLLNAVYAGPKDQGLALLKPFFDLNPVVQEIKTVPWNRVVTTAGFGLNSAFCVKGNIHSMFSLGIKNIDVATQASVFAKMVQFYDEFPAARGSTLEIEFFPTQAVLAVPDSATAYPWRDAQAQIMLQFSWTDPSLEDRVNSFARSLRAEYVATSGYDSLEVYVSYAHGDEPLEQIYGAEKLPRLIGLKNKWDPHNVFAFNNALPTSLAGTGTGNGNGTYSGSGNSTSSGEKNSPSTGVYYMA